ncbi:methyltransferase, partial [Marine Group III euryarchaeote]|nr:methyltransferase [Marine Group III euryarchaeote]
MEDIEIENFEGVYEPAEDSWMMCNYLPENLDSVLEIGCGSGIISIHLAKKGNNVTSIDINPKAVKATKLNAEKNQVHLEVLESNMFQKVKGRKFDSIVCNPPYLPPTEEYNDPE